MKLYIVIFSLFLFSTTSIASVLSKNDEIMEKNNRTLYIPSENFIPELVSRNYNSYSVFINLSIDKEGELKSFFIKFMNKIKQSHAGTYINLPSDSSLFIDITDSLNCSIPNNIENSSVILFIENSDCIFLEVSNYYSLISVLQDIKLHLSNGESNIFIKSHIDKVLADANSKGVENSIINFLIYINSKLM